MYDIAVDKYPRNLRYIPDWFMTDYIEKIALQNNNNPKGYIERKKNNEWIKEYKNRKYYKS